jgi:hypothetical protein
MCAALSLPNSFALSPLSRLTLRMQSNHDRLELPRQKNSYYVKAATSMLERFRLDWEPENEEHGLVANRCNDTHMPVVLLIDLDTPGTGAGSGGGGAGAGNGHRGGTKDREQAGGTQTAAASGAGASKQQPRMTLMKRAPKESIERSKHKVCNSPTHSRALTRANECLSS